ncbi:MAG: DUF4249 domain-containing protein [Cyclobacteriaceae bacterium]
MKTNIYLLSILMSSMLIITACEDEVQLDLPDAPAVMAVDAFINDKAGEQTIFLTLTQPYFSDVLPEGISGASVLVEDDLGNAFPFTEEEPGKYTWTPSAGETIGEVGRSYMLEVAYDGFIYTAQSEMKRVPPVDSVVFTYDDEDNPFQEPGYYAEFVATDPVGPGDYYWIKSYKNDTLLIRPFELNIAADAGFSPGIDGVVFIQPIQNSVNPLDDDLALIPYVPGDSLYVESHSLTESAWEFLNQVAIQTQRDGGFDEIFAEPLENVPTNLEADQPDAPPVVGFFSVSAVEGNGKRLR